MPIAWKWCGQCRTMPLTLQYVTRLMVWVLTDKRNVSARIQNTTESSMTKRVGINYPPRILHGTSKGQQEPNHLGCELLCKILVERHKRLDLLVQRTNWANNVRLRTCLFILWLPDKGCDNKPLRTCKATNYSSDRKAHKTLRMVVDELCKAGW